MPNTGGISLNIYFTQMDKICVLKEVKCSHPGVWGTTVSRPGLWVQRNVGECHSLW